MRLPVLHDVAIISSAMQNGGRTGMLDSIRRTDTDSGCSVITVARTDVESVALGFFAGVGSRYESAEESGYSHFLEHMLFKGTRRRSAAAVSRAVESRGGNMNAATGVDSTFYYVVIPSDGFRYALDVIGDIYTQPLISERDTERERLVILEEMKSYDDDPSSKADEMFQECMWPEHPLGRSIIGTEQSLGAASGASLLEYHSRFYTPGNTAVVAVGNLSHDYLVRKADALFSASRRGGLADFRSFNGESPVKRLSADIRDIEQINAVAGFRVQIGRCDKRMHALRILNLILGGNMSSRLFQSVRERRGLAYSVSSFAVVLKETGFVAISAGFDKDRGVRGLRHCGIECRKLLEQGVSPVELARAKRYLSGALKIGLEGTYSQMKWIGKQFFDGKYLSPEEYVDGLAGVTCDDVMSAAHDVFKRENAALSIVMPEKCTLTPENHLEAFVSGLGQ